VEKDGGEKIFFIGDSFTPSGIDDYCLQNRNLLSDNEGYLYCLDLLKTRIPPEALLINEHVLEPFRFSRAQLDHMTRILIERRALLHDLFPWDQPNYGIDERWARIDPYGQEIRAGEQATLTVRIQNHSRTPQSFRVALHAPNGFKIQPDQASITVAPGQEGTARFTAKVPNQQKPGVQVITADIYFGPWRLHQWCEALLNVMPAKKPRY
jgi:hypothetical protein